MSYWIQEAALAGAQGADSSLPSAILSGGVVGAVVGLIGVLIGQVLTQRRHSQTIEQTAELETRRANRAAELEAQRAHEAALQKYFELVGNLLIEHPENASLGTVARAQTLAVLEGLDPDRKRILLQFLYESDLIEAEKPVITLRGANLRGAYLKGAFLEGADLERAERLTQEQIDEAFGDEDTKLPDHLQRPAHWGKRDRPRAPKQKGYQGAPPRTTNINAWR